MNIGHGMSLEIRDFMGQSKATITRNCKPLVSRFAPTEAGAITSVIQSAPFLRESQIEALRSAAANA